MKFIFVLIFLCGIANAEDAAPESPPAVVAPTVNAPATSAPVVPEATVPKTVPVVKNTKGSSKTKPADEDNGEYEVDYEEEDDSEAEAAPTPAKKTTQKNQGPRLGGGPAVQGSRAQNRFISLLKSDTKSVYKKNGKAMDVDSD